MELSVESAEPNVSKSNTASALMSARMWSTLTCKPGVALKFYVGGWVGRGDHVSPGMRPFGPG